MWLAYKIKNTRSPRGTELLDDKTKVSQPKEVDSLTIFLFLAMFLGREQDPVPGAPFRVCRGWGPLL